MRTPTSIVLSVAGLAGLALYAVPGNTFAAAPVRPLEALRQQAASQPRDANAHVALATALEGESLRRGDQQLRELAAAGYQSALRLAPGDYRANLLAGRVEFEAGRPYAAAGLFAAAALASPDDPTAFLALAVAAHQSGDAALASLAAERAAALAPTRAEPWRLLALARATQGDAAGAAQALQQWTVVQTQPAARVESTQRRVATLVRTRWIDEEPQGGVAAATPISNATGNDQVTVDVAIILNQQTRRTRVGFNLLDGLRAQFSYSDQLTESRVDGIGPSQSTITRAISTPLLSYNLNLFNHVGQSYRVVARPTLTAYRGETSEFFIGRTSNIPVSGVNTAQLERVDIGVSMKVTPLEIDGDKVKVRVETGRSFASPDAAGSFTEALTVFRQTVVATAEVRFGESLLLSGLTENVDDGTTSRTPGLGDVPLLGLAFNERSNLSRRDAALVLLTPSRPVSLAGQSWARPAGVERLLKYWSTVIDPGSNAEEVARRLVRAPRASRAESADADLAWGEGGGLRAFRSLLTSNPL
jgi:Bacterial type II and III secretion system protein